MIKKDKILHFVAGALIYLLGYLLGFHPIGILMLVLLIAIAKEVIWDDFMGKGTPEFLDVIFTLMGGFAIFLITLII